MKDGGRPPEDGLQDQFSNHPQLLGDKNPGGERGGKRQDLILSGVDQEGERK